MSKNLLSAFASDDPERFAQLLGTYGDPAETISILADLPDGMEGDVVAKLAPEAATRLLNELPDSLLIAWLGSCPADTARRVLARMHRERSARLISGIDDRSKRRGLRRLVEYSPGTVGELVQIDVLAIRDSALASEIRGEIQRQGGGADAPVAITRENGAVRGVLDLARFLKSDDRDACANDFLVPTKPVFAEASQASLVDREEWSQLTSLPVVDYDGQLIGYVSRSSLGSGPESVSGGNRFLQSAIELSKQFFEVMAHVLTMVFNGRNPR